VDARVLADFSALNARINAGGFEGERTVRVRTGDLQVAAADTVTARAIRLSADAGNVIIAGALDASSPTGGGSIDVFTGGNATIAATGRLLARGTGTGPEYSHGGSVRVAARTGALSMEGNPAAAAEIDVSAGARGDAGRVVLAAARTPSNDAVQASLQGTVRALPGSGGRGGELVVEGWRAYPIATRSGAEGTPYALEYAAFMNALNPTAPFVALDTPGIAAADRAVRAGIELTSAQDLALTSAWNLGAPNWNAGDQPGALLVRSAGNLTVSQALGLGNDAISLVPTWTMTLVAGADTSASDPRSVQSLSVLSAAGRGDLVLNGANARVRSGSGDIALYAGRDFAINNIAAVVYSSGVSGADGGTASRFPVRGGDIEIRAQRDAKGVDTATQWVNAWQRRTTFNTQVLADRATAVEWWSVPANFRHNVGSLAGGDVSIVAGQNVDRLSAVLPSAGRVSTANGADSLSVTGGGQLVVSAGDSVLGGEYYVGLGRGSVTAGGMVGRGAPTALWLAGDSTDPASRGARVDVVARTDADIQSIANPTLLFMPTVAATPGFQRFRPTFSTYAPTSGASILSVAGDLVLHGETRSTPAGAPAGFDSGITLLPPQIDFLAPQGAITGLDTQTGAQTALVLMPSPHNRLAMLARDDIANIGVTVSDTGRAYLPAWNNLTTPGAGRNTYILPNAQASFFPIGFANEQFARLPERDTAAGVNLNVESSAGSVVESSFYLPKVSTVRAARDLRSVGLILQNLDPQDVTRVVAGRDIRYPDLRRSGLPQINPLELRVDGPGAALFQSGRTIDLGRIVPDGLFATGNVESPNLASADSARLVLVAGVRGDVRVAELDRFFAALKDAGTRQDAGAGDLAVAEFFSGSAVGTGDINTFFSAVRTAGGSGIDLLVPNGDVNAGLTVPTGGTTGIITLRGGAVRSYLSGDFNVNVSRVLTALGGDILIYTGDGSIDAGRGALTSRTTTPPRLIRRDDGSVTFELGIDVAGSGIRTVTADPDGAGPQPAPRAGDVFLFAPRGIIDAGEAGIASGGNLVLAALQVVNASNISAAGSSVGVPQAPVSVAAGFAGASNVGTGAAKAAEDATRAATQQAQAANIGDTFRPSFITVEVLGFGN
jgi:hypothetical protein